MKLQHAPGFALVVWYLILPPPAPFGRRLTYEPLSDWKLIEKFDSNRTCQEMRSKLIDLMRGTAIDTARCVPADDPDLMPGVFDDLDVG
jgi:hypothetical protein